MASGDISIGPAQRVGAGCAAMCGQIQSVEMWPYDATTTILRQSIDTHFEAPFMYLLVGRERAMVIDTGTGDADIGAAVDRAIADRDVDLVVAHTHGHSDHVGGDARFAGRARTTVIGHAISAVEETYRLSGVSNVGRFDLGDRIVDVIPVPGHEPSHVAFYDRDTQLLFTGDVLYPGRLYVRDWPTFQASIARLVRFIDDGHPVQHILGSHVELSSAGEEFPDGASAHPNERFHALGEAHLRELHATLQAMDAPRRVPRRDWVIVPVD
jgi:hydroxyacylglutathione hydrolase